jgi:uncharacterized protein (TIGR03435 family)
MLLQRAYGLNPAQIAGPDWIEDVPYDIVAKFPTGATKDDVPAMLKQLLTERFHVVLHFEPKTLKAYEVTVAKGGPTLTVAKMRPKFDDPKDQEAYVKNMLIEMEMGMRARVAAGETPGQMRNVNGSTLANFLKTISYAFDWPLKDNTGITGTYDIQVEWASAPTGSPSIFAAFEEQLGLKVQPANEEMEYLVIDSASRTPDAN